MNDYAILEEMEDHLKAVQSSGQAPDYSWLMSQLKQLKINLGSFELLATRSGPYPLPYERPTEFELLTGLGSPQAEALGWARDFKQMEGASEENLRLAFYLFSKLGFTPVGTKRSWLKKLDDLYSRSGSFVDIQQGVKAAKISRLTLGGPESLNKFVYDAQAKRLSGRGDKPQDVVSI